jgi:hypothetical protein
MPQQESENPPWFQQAMLSINTNLESKETEPVYAISW